jgi:hypothetical protein
MIKWKEDELQKAKEMILSNHSYFDISKSLNKSYESVSKKLRRINFNTRNRGGNDNKYKNKRVFSVNWSEVQEYYDGNKTYRDVISHYKLNPIIIRDAIRLGFIKMRSRNDAIKLSRKLGKGNKSSLVGLPRYRQLCAFSFGLKQYKEEFDFLLIEKYGWYKAKNRGNNPLGVSRDHMFSVKDGFKQNVSPELIKHPANCVLIQNKDNQSKGPKSSITLNELKDRIRAWDLKYPPK